MPEYLDDAPLLMFMYGRCGSKAQTFYNQATRQPRHLVARLPAVGAVSAWRQKAGSAR